MKEINRLQHLAVEKSRLHIPLLFGFDVIHGYRTAFPVPLAMASSWDPSVEEAAQKVASEDARAAGIRWTFTPMVDIASDARSAYMDLNDVPATGNHWLVTDHIKSGESTEVQVDVTNTGSIAGDAVAQVYIHQRAGSASRPVRQLKGFRRIALKPGETQTLKFPLGKDELSFWSPQTKVWAVEPGTFDVWAGEDSTATLQTQFEVTN